jgi:zinc protease
MLAKELVQEKRIAVAAQSQANFPGSRYRSLFVFVIAPALGHTVDENQKAVDDILARLANERLDPAILARAKMQAKVGAMRRLSTNPGLAFLLAAYAGSYGDWHRLFTGLEDLDKVSATDVQRVVRQYFVPTGRTTAYSVAPPPRVAAPGRGASR